MTTATPVQNATETWNIDPAHSEAGFAVKHLMISTVKGSFRSISGHIALDPAHPAASSVQAEIDVSSIDTRSEQRDTHLRSPDFFDAETYPTITFRSRAVQQRLEGEYRVTGDLTIRDVTREVVLNVTETGRARDPWGGERIGFSAETRIDRTDYGLTWNAALETGGVLVGNEIRISLEIQAVLAN